MLLGGAGAPGRPAWPQADPEAPPEHTTRINFARQGSECAHSSEQSDREAGKPDSLPYFAFTSNPVSSIKLDTRKKTLNLEDLQFARSQTIEQRGGAANPRPVSKLHMPHPADASGSFLQRKKTGEEDYSVGSDYTDLVGFVPTVKGGQLKLEPRERSPGEELAVFPLFAANQASSPRDGRLKTMNTMKSESALERILQLQTGASLVLAPPKNQTPNPPSQDRRKKSFTSFRSTGNSKDLWRGARTPTEKSCRAGGDSCPKHRDDFRCECEVRRASIRRDNFLQLAPAQKSDAKPDLNRLFKLQNTTNFDEHSVHHPDFWRKLKF